MQCGTVSVPLDYARPRGPADRTLRQQGPRDAATPYDGALELRDRLAGSVLVTERDAGAHGLAGGPNACVNGHLEAYLLEGRLPGRRAQCAPHPVEQTEQHPEAAAEAENSRAVYLAVECNDAPWPSAWRVWDRDNTRLARVAPIRSRRPRTAPGPSNASADQAREATSSAMSLRRPV
nr:alpha/beta hydrolase [Streptomyces sp. SID5643]